MLNAVRLSFGTLSVLPVGHPTRLDRRTWGRAMLLAPVVGLVLGCTAWACAFGATELSDAPLLGAVTGVAALAVLTRGLHLDGLADVADGLGSGSAPAQAREVMKRSDIGPFGVITLMLVVLTQVAALELLLAMTETAAFPVALIGGAVLSRATITWTCRRGVVAATSGGLGGQAAESLPVAAAVSVLAGSFALVVGAVALAESDQAVAVTVSAVISLVTAEVWRRHCSRRFGGITGDVLGAVEQVAFTTFVMSLVLLLP